MIPTILMVAGLALNVDEARKDVNFDVRDPPNYSTLERRRENERVGEESMCCWLVCMLFL